MKNCIYATVIAVCFQLQIEAMKTAPQMIRQSDTLAIPPRTQFKSVPQRSFKSKKNQQRSNSAIYYDNRQINVVSGRTPPSNKDIVMFMIRHARTEQNVGQQTHSPGTDHNIKIVGEEYNLQFINWIAKFYEIDIVFSGNKRCFVSSYMLEASKSIMLKLLGEQILCVFGSENDVINSPDFKRMLNDPEYCIGSGESGQQVIDRFRKSIKFITNYAKATGGSRLAIITSRLFMNWVMRFLSENLLLPPVNMRNWDAIVLVYNSMRGDIRLLDSTPRTLYELPDLYRSLFVIPNVAPQQVRVASKKYDEQFGKNKLRGSSL